MRGRAYIFHLIWAYIIIWITLSKACTYSHFDLMKVNNCN